MNPDFSQLYSQLDIEPDCSLEEFVLAYRRLITRLHPDKQDLGYSGLESALPLADLTPLYATALRFHRRYGRLPGGRVRNHDARWNARRSPRLPLVPRMASQPESGRQGPGPWRWLLASALVGVLLALAFCSTRPETLTRVAAVPVAEPEQDARLVATRLPEYLELGMDPATVRMIQGDPVRIRENEWEYGPSWLRFEKGALVDWYSSPFYRLKTATPAPPPASVQANP